MYYILYEGLKIESNEPVYCTVYIIHAYKFTYMMMMMMISYDELYTNIIANAILECVLSSTFLYI